MERTYIMIKPDGVQRGCEFIILKTFPRLIVTSCSLVGEIVSRFEKKVCPMCFAGLVLLFLSPYLQGFKLQAMKLYQPERSLLEAHYGTQVLFSFQPSQQSPFPFTFRYQLICQPRNFSLG